MICLVTQSDVIPGSPVPVQSQSAHATLLPFLALHVVLVKLAADLKSNRMVSSIWDRNEPVADFALPLRQSLYVAR